MKCEHCNGRLDVHKRTSKLGKEYTQRRHIEFPYGFCPPIKCIVCKHKLKLKNDAWVFFEGEYHCENCFRVKITACNANYTKEEKENGIH